MDRDQETRVVPEAETFGVALFTYLFQRRRPEEYIPERTAGGVDENPATAGGVEDFFTTDVGEAVLLMCHLHGNWFSNIFTRTFPEGLDDFSTFWCYVSGIAHMLYDGNEIFDSLLMVSAMIIEMRLYCLRPYARFAVPAGKCWSSIFLNLFAENFFKFGGWQALQKVSHDKARIYENVKQEYTKLSLNSPFIYRVDAEDVVLPEPLAFEVSRARVRENKALQSISREVLKSLSQESLGQISESKLEADSLQQNSPLPFSDHDLPAEITDRFKGHLFHENKYLREVLKSSDVTGYAPTSVEKLDSNKASKSPSETKSREISATPKTTLRNEYSFQRLGTINYTDEKDILEIFKALVNLENADDGKCISQLLCSNENVQLLMGDTKYLRLIKETVEKPLNKPDTKRLVEDAKNIIVEASFTAELSHPPENQPIDIPFESRDNLEQNLDLQNLQKTSSNDDLATSMEALKLNIVGKPSSENKYSVLGAIPKTTIKSREILQTSDNELSLYDYDLLYKFKDIVKNENEDGLYLSKLLSSSGISQHLMNDHYLNLMKDVVIHKKKPDTKQLLEHARRIIDVLPPEILENELLENQPHNIASRSDESSVRNRQILEKGNEPPENLLNISTPESESRNPFENKPMETSFKSEGESLKRPDRSEMCKEPSPRQKPEEHAAIDVDCRERIIESAAIYLDPEPRAESSTNVDEILQGAPEPRYIAEVFRHLNSKLGTNFPVSGAFELAYLRVRNRTRKAGIKPELIAYSEKLIKKIRSLMANVSDSFSDSTEFQGASTLETEARTRYGVLVLMLRRFKARLKGTSLSQDFKQTTKELIFCSGHLLQTLDMQEKEIRRRSLIENAQQSRCHERVRIEYVATDTDCHKRNIPEVSRQYPFESKSNISLESEECLEQDRPEIFKEQSPMQEPEKHLDIDADCHKRNIGSPERSPKTKERKKSVVNEAVNPHGVLKPWYMGKILEHLNSKLGTTFPVDDTFEWKYIDSLTRSKKIPIMMELLRFSKTLAKRIEDVTSNIQSSAARAEVQNVLRRGRQVREKFYNMIRESKLEKGRTKDIEISQYYTGLIKDIFHHNQIFYEILDANTKELQERLSIFGRSSGGAGNIKAQTSQSQKPYDWSSSKSSHFPVCTAEGASFLPGRITEPPGISSDKALTQVFDTILDVSCFSASEEKRDEFFKMIKDFITPSDKQQSVATEVSCIPSEGTAGATFDTETTELGQDTAQSDGNATNLKKKEKSKRKK